MASSKTPEIQVLDGVTVIQLGPDYESLDEHLLDDLRTFLLQCCETADPARVVIDLSHTTFFGSAFIEILVQIWKGLSDCEGGEFAISGLTPNCAEVLQVTHLDSLWKIFDTREEAVAAITDA